jgi:DNA-binding NarL/FixJ family response regulator
MPITLVLADDDPVVLDWLQQLFVAERDFAVVGRCPDGKAALEAVRRHRPDILALDLQMPGMKGLAVLQALRAEQLPTRVVALTTSLEADDPLEAVRLGARGLVLKGMARHLLVPCVRRVAAGERWLEAGEAQAPSGLSTREAAIDAFAGVLTLREVEIARLVAQGLRNKEIARQLAITEGTVKIHLHNIYRKLGVDSRVALTLWAQANDIV